MPRHKRGPPHVCIPRCLCHHRLVTVDVNSKGHEEPPSSAKRISIAEVDHGSISRRFVAEANEQEGIDQRLSSIDVH